MLSNSPLSEKIEELEIAIENKHFFFVCLELTY